MNSPILDRTAAPARGEIVRAADKPLRQVATVNELFVNKQAVELLRKVAARHMNPERMMRIMWNATRVTPKLGQCDPLTLLGALMNCATLGLEPNTPLGHAYLIPFENRRANTTDVQLIVGYKGMIDMARRSGLVRTILAEVVYSDDEIWSYEYGSQMHLRHKLGPREGTKIAAYCHVHLTDGEAFVVMPWAEVMKVRNGAQGYRRAVQYGDKTAPWIAHEDAMARKTAIRAMANRGLMPVSVEMVEALDVDEQHVDFAAFARDPGAGPQILGPMPEPEPEPEPENVLVEAPDDPPAAELAPSAEPPPRRRQGGRQDAPRPAGNRAAMEAAMTAILGDALDGGAEAARRAHAATIAEMRRTQPDLFARLEDELIAFGDRGGQDDDD